MIAVLASPAARYAAVALIAASCAWQAQSWRYGAQIAFMREQQANAIAVAHGRMQDMSNRLALADQNAIKKLTEAQHENDTLRRAVAAGTQRLRIKATCLPADSGPASMGDAGTAELGAEAGQDILDIRTGIIGLEAKLEALRNYARTVSP